MNQRLERSKLQLYFSAYGAPALLAYLIIAAIAFAFYELNGLNSLGESPLPVGARLLSLPFILILTPIWYVRDTFDPALPLANSVLRVIGALVAAAVAIMVSKRILRSRDK